MRIAFFNPGSKEASFTKHRMPPINLTGMAHEAHNLGAETLTVDGNYISVPRAIDALRQFAPDVLGVTTYFRENCFAEELEIVDALGEDVALAVGGYDATYNPLVLEEFNPDFLIKGEGEYPIAELVRTGLSPSKIDKELVKARKHKSETWILEALKPYNLDRLPLPNQLTNIFPVNGRFSAGLINVVRGCIGRCTFCVGGDKRPTYATPRYVVEQIKAWQSLLPPKSLLLFVASDFTANPGIANDIIKLINQEPGLIGLHYGFAVRVDTLGIAMEKAPSDWEYFLSHNKVDIDAGVEALDQSQLTGALNKTQNPDKYLSLFLEILEMGKKTNTLIGANLLIFTPETTLDEALNDYAGLLALAKQYGNIMVTPDAIARELIIYPGTMAATRFKNPSFNLALDEKTIPLAAYKDKRTKALLCALRENSDYFGINEHSPLATTLNRIVSLIEWIKKNFPDSNNSPNLNQIDDHVDWMRQH